MLRLYLLYFLLCAVIQTVGIWHAIPWASDKRIVREVQEKRTAQDTSDENCDWRFDEMKVMLDSKLVKLLSAIYPSDMNALQEVAYGIAELEQIEREYSGSPAVSKSKLVVSYVRKLNSLRKAINRTKSTVSSAALAVGDHVQAMVDELPRTVSRRWSEVSGILSRAESGYPFWRAVKKMDWADQFSRDLLPREVEKYLEGL